MSNTAFQHHTPSTYVKNLKLIFYGVRDIYSHLFKPAAATRTAMKPNIVSFLTYDKIMAKKLRIGYPVGRL